MRCVHAAAAGQSTSQAKRRGAGRLVVGPGGDHLHLVDGHAQLPRIGAAEVGRAIGLHLQHDGGHGLPGQQPLRHGEAIGLRARLIEPADLGAVDQHPIHSRQRAGREVDGEGQGGVGRRVAGETEPGAGAVQRIVLAVGLPTAVGKPTAGLPNMLAGSHWYQSPER